MNEISRISERLGANINSVRLGMGADKRIGYQFTHPGLGYGGSCFPKDVKALLSSAKQLGVQADLLTAVETVNQSQRKWFYNKITEHFSGDLSKKTFALWGLSFKPNTDDIREAPALDIAKWLTDSGAKVIAYDPIAMKTASSKLKDLNNFSTIGDAYSALKDADALVLCTEWELFCSPDFEKMKNLMKQNIIFDGRNQYEPDQMMELGFQYYSVGRTLV